MTKKPKGVPDANNKLSNFLSDKLIPMILAGIHAHMIGRVISYKKGSGRCEVQPLALQSDGDKRAPLTEVVVPDSIEMINDIKEFASWAKGHTHPTVGGPIPSMPEGILRHEFKVGSVVWIGFSDTEIDNWTGTDNFAIETKRQHSIQDAVVEAVIKS